ncbi:MAG TPA: ATP-binding protein [Oculatellaceae cyanobacterium]|jgi:PAS domain S-box-containing protein
MNGDQTYQSVIFLVDDTPTNLEVLINVLDNSGFQVLVAEDGESAIEKIDYAQPDLILLDVLMPGIDGFETCRRLKANESTQNIPIIFMTALSETLDKVTGLNLGAVDYITKPLQHEEVLARIKIHLCIQQLTNQLKQKNIFLEQLTSELEQRVEARTKELSQSNQLLQQEIRERLAAEAKLLERTRLAELNADIGAALSRNYNLSKILQECAEAVVINLDAAFVGIWTLKEAHNMLELQASAGMCTNLNNSYSRIPVGKYKIGWIAAHRQPHLTNSVIGDPMIKDQEWAKQEKIVAFAGYPLIVEERLFGVIAMFARQSLPAITLEAMASVANNIALGIQGKQTELALQESEERFRSFAENVRQVFWMTNKDSTSIIYISPAYEKIWGRNCERLYEKPLAFFEAIHPEDQEKVFAAIKTQINGEYDQEYRIIQPKGNIRWIRDRAFPIQNELGQVYRIVGVAEDITDRKLAEEEIHNALTKEKELSQLKSRFITIASHEFRTPLTTILSAAQALRTYFHNWTEEKKFAYLQYIEDAVEHMSGLLNDVLVIAKAEAGKLEFSPLEMDLVEFCSELTEEIQLNDSNRHKINFIICSNCFGVSASSVLADMDENLLRQIFSNLLANAIKYSPSDSAVQFKLTCENDYAIFQIQDSGIGIPLKDQKLLFDPFHRAENVGNIPGTGLGLTIVKNSCSLHGGSISVDSEVGKGTTFTVILPLRTQTKINE